MISSLVKKEQEICKFIKNDLPNKYFSQFLSRFSSNIFNILEFQEDLFSRTPPGFDLTFWNDVGNILIINLSYVGV